MDATYKRNRGGKEYGCYETGKQLTYVDRLWYTGSICNAAGASFCKGSLQLRGKGWSYKDADEEGAEK